MKYQIVGEPLPVVICDVDAGQSLISEKGAMSWMSHYEIGRASCRERV